ncbi:MAG: flagellar filament capping protein FliD [Lachnospiraceae bacterium]|nr:flagellar filament capping protein FliD [Lachnospiraceae bacterium]
MINHNIYNYYGMAYLPKTNTKYDTHKSKELKEVYQSMVRHNKQSPLFKFKMSEETQNYALSIKDAAIGLKNISSFLSDDVDAVFDKKVLASSDESVLDVRVNTDDYDKLPDSMELTVHSLAGKQENLGRFVNSKAKGIASGSFGLHLKTDGGDYQITLGVNSSTRNIDAQQAIADAINHQHIGLRADVVTKGNESALHIESLTTGEGKNPDGLIFSFTENNPNQPIINFIGLNQVSVKPHNSSFSINGEEHESATNSISINNAIEIDLLKASDKPVTLSKVPDTGEIMEKVEDFVNSYNNLIKLANDNMDSQHSAKKLLNDISKITRRHANSLEASGLTVDEKGYLKQDEALLVQSSKNGQFKSLFNDISDFKTDITQTTDQLNLDPLAYVDKVIVTYPDTSKTQPNPFVPSVYSGLLFNSYA